MYRRAMLAVIAFVVSVSSLSALLAQPAAADTPSLYISSTVKKAATMNVEANSLAMCIGYDPTNTINVDSKSGDLTSANAATGSWFRRFTTVREFFDYNKGSDGMSCDKINVKNYLSDLGWSSNIQAVCDIGFAKRSNCASGSGDFTLTKISKGDALAKITSHYKTSFGTSFDTAEQRYVMATSVLTNSATCGITAVVNLADATTDQKNNTNYKQLAVIDSTGTRTTVLYKVKSSWTADKWSYANYTGSGTNFVSHTCSELMTIANNNANAYAQWVKANLPGSANNAGTCEEYAAQATLSSDADAKTLEAACNDGQSNKTDTSYCTKYTTSAEKSACEYGQKIAVDASSDTTGTGEATKTCGIDGVGWLVCPVMKFLANVNDQAFGFLASHFLAIDTSLVSTTNGTYTAWSSFRNLANICFIFAFLVIIYSQITSAGISNYGIKRMLPRVIVAVILVNISFFICQIAVDISNIVGYGAYHLLSGGISVATIGGLAADTTASTGQTALLWATVITTIVAASVGVALAVSVPVLMAALLAIGLVVLILIARQAIVVLLVAISPLAFVAWLLPNTEQWFKKWNKTFFSMLMLFPTIGAVYGASQLAANIINSSGTAGSSGSDDDIILRLVALAVSALPFFVVPTLLKGSLAATGAIGAKLQGLSGKMDGRVRNKVGESRLGDVARYQKQRSKINQARSRAGVNRFRGGNKNPLNWGAATNRVTNRVLPNRVTDQYARTAAGIEDKEFEDNVSAAAVLHKGMLNSDIEHIAATGTSRNGKTVSDAERVAATREIMKTGNPEQRMRLIEASSTMSDKTLQSVRDGMYASGMQTYLGGGFGDKLMSRQIKGAADVNQEIANTLDAGKFKAETITKDGTAINRVTDVVKRSQNGEQFTLTKRDSAGNPVLDANGNTIKELRSLNASTITGLKSAAESATRTPTINSNIADNMRGSVDYLRNL